jgi:hypothetical protein
MVLWRSILVVVDFFESLVHFPALFWAIKYSADSLSDLRACTLHLAVSDTSLNIQGSVPVGRQMVVVMVCCSVVGYCCCFCVDSEKFISLMDSAFRIRQQNLQMDPTYGQFALLGLFLLI